MLPLNKHCIGNAKNLTLNAPVYATNSIKLCNALTDFQLQKLVLSPYTDEQSGLFHQLKWTQKIVSKNDVLNDVLKILTC